MKFSRYIVAKFFELLPKNPVLLAELVVWKFAGDCYEIVEGYGSLALRYEIISANNRACTVCKNIVSSPLFLFCILYVFFALKTRLNFFAVFSSFLYINICGQ